jgi:hypothetical protein
MGSFEESAETSMEYLYTSRIASFISIYYIQFTQSNPSESPHFYTNAGRAFHTGNTYLSVTDPPEPSLASSDDGRRNKPPIVANIHYPADSSHHDSSQANTSHGNQCTTTAATPAPTSNQKSPTKALYPALTCGGEIYATMYLYDYSSQSYKY